MPNYKRKKVKKSLFHNKDHFENNEIVMKPKKKASQNVVPNENVKVIRGSQFARKRATHFILCFSLIVCIALILLSMILPVGIYENVINYSNLIGHGKYPVDVSGSSVINSVSSGAYYYVLTDTSITAYSNSGKNVLNDMHGFANPIMSVSDTRVLVYDQGGKYAYIYNLGGKIYTYESESEIISASISRNGSFAVASHSDKFTSVVNVYNKKFKKVYTWNCAKEIINNVLVNESGNRLAVSTLNAIGGQYSSKLYILKFDSANPVYSLDLGSSIALSLINTKKGVSVIANDKYKFIHWIKHTTNEISVSGEVNIVRNSKNGILLAINRANDRSDNTIILISNSGKKFKEFKINNLITDIQYSKGRVYFISDTSVKILDSEGNVLRNGLCNYGTKRFMVVSPNSIVSINDQQIIKLDIQKGEE